jgi:hypothetical protein
LKSIVKLYKPSGTYIDNLSSVIELTRIRKYTGVNEIRFRLPENVEDTKTGKQIDNLELKNLKYDYRINYEDEFYIIRGINKIFDNNIKKVEITCYSKVIQLRDRRCKVQTGVLVGETVIPVKTLSQTANLVLANTSFTLGIVDVVLDTKYRAVDIDGNVLDSLNKLSEIWDCVWIATNNKINFIDYKNNYTFNGVFLSDANYIKGMNLSIREDSIITKLSIKGVDGISVNAVNNGQSYISDYGFYMNTDYMEQSMIDALNAYIVAVNNSKPTYTTYLTQLSSLQAALTTKNNELTNLKLDLDKKQIQIDDAVYQGNDSSALKSEYNTIKNNISSKQSEINLLNSQITAKNNQIQILNNSIAINNFLTSTHLSLLNEYTKEGEFEDSTITAKGTDIPILQELLGAAQEYLSLNNQPRFDATIDIIAFNQLADEDSKIYSDKLNLGSLLKIYVKKLDVMLSARLIEVEEDFDGHRLSIKISNQKDINDGSFKLDQLLQTASDTKNLVNINIDKWNHGEAANNFISENIANGINTLNTEIRNSTNTYSLNERGGVFVDKVNSNFVTIITGQGIMLSTDGGVTPNIAMGKGRIYGELIGSKIITSNTGLFNKMETYDNANNLVCEIGNYTSSIDASAKRGIKISNGALEISGGILESQLSPAVANSYVKLGKSYNNVVIDSANGIQVIRSDNKVKTTINATDGIKISTGAGNGIFGTNVLSIDTNGYATFGGIVKAKDFQDINGNSFLSYDKTQIEGSVIKADTLYVNSANITGTIVADTVRSNWIYTGTITAGQINGRIAKLDDGIEIGDTRNALGKSIRFSTGVSIYTSNTIFGPWGLTIDASEVVLPDLTCNNLRVNGNLSGVDYASSGHTHGNSYVKSRNSQNLALSYDANTSRIHILYNGASVGFLDLMW